MAITFEDFMMTVPPENQGFVMALHERLIEQGARLGIKAAKNGYVTSYQWDGKTILNWVFRKSGMVARIYGDNAARYEELVAALPEPLLEKLKKSGDCKRLLDPTACSPTCVMGMVFNLGGETLKKCRYNGMLFPLTDETGDGIQSLVLAELAARKQ